MQKDEENDPPCENNLVSSVHVVDVSAVDVSAERAVVEREDNESGKTYS